MIFDEFTKASQEIANFGVAHPIAAGIVTAAIVIGGYKIVKDAIAKRKVEKARQAELDTDLERLKGIVTPIEFPPPRP